MHRKKAHYERIGIAYMPCTVAGWGFLFGFVISTLALVFLASAAWAFSGWQGADVIRGLILIAGALTMVRFAHKRST